MKIVHSRWIPFRGFSAINLFGVIFVRKDLPDSYSHQLGLVFVLWHRCSDNGEYKRSADESRQSDDKVIEEQSVTGRPLTAFLA